MIVEHIFITTYEAPQAMRLASQLLASRGFVAQAQQAFQLGADSWNSLEMQRGKKNPARAKSVLELPQQVRLDYDRGRVTVAASAQSVQESRASGVSRKPKGRPAVLQQHMLTSVALSLQKVLQERHDVGQIAAEWAQHEMQIHNEDRSRRKRNMAIALSVFGICMAIVIAIIIAAATH